MSQKQLIQCDSVENGAQCTSKVEVTQLPPEWTEPCMFGTILGQFCPGCSARITLAGAVQIAKARRR